MPNVPSATSTPVAKGQNAAMHRSARIGRDLLSLLTVLLLAASMPQASAQAVQFGGVTTTLGGSIFGASGVAMDSSGNAYAVSIPGTAVSKIPAGCMSSSCITTLGGGLTAPESIAIDGSGNLYITNTGNSVIDEIPTGCTTTSCMVVLGGNFSSPEGVAVDGSGNVYVADSMMSVISEIPAGCTATKFAASLCAVTTLKAA